MTNIINILRMADERSLVILDDLGAGTDPSEGSSLAQALLLHLLRRRITTFVATHYPELKVFAHATTGIENACVEFDVETLSPTYKLSIGLPGRSNALEIAERLGLRPEIVEEARNLMSPRELETEELLLDIRRAHEEAIKEREEAKRARQEAEELKRELEERLRELKVSRREILQVAREEARRELRAVKEELRGIRARLRAASFEEELIKQSEEKLEEIERRTAPPEPIPSLSLREPISVGDTVSIKRLGITGEVISLSEDGAEVQAGRFRLKARLEDLEKTTSTIRGDFLPSASFHTSPGLEIDLRGQTVEEALPRLDKYLDDSYLAELPFVRVIHGKGEGILRRAVREMLNGHPLVESHRPGEEHEGGDGVTVVKLTS
jgi:DNA mismatch repair protein MutS2